MSMPVTKINKALLNKRSRSQMKRKISTRKGIPIKIKKTLIGKMVGNGLVGNVYKPIPTKVKSKYVPSKEAKQRVGNTFLIED